MPEEYEKELRKFYQRFKPQLVLYYELGLMDFVEELKAMILEDDEAECIRKSIRARYEDQDFGTGLNDQIYPCIYEFDPNNTGNVEPKKADWSDHNA